MEPDSRSSSLRFHFVRNENRPKLNWRTSLIGAAAAALLALPFLRPALEDSLAGWSYDLLFAPRQFLQNYVPVDGVTLVYLDLESHNRLGQPRFEQRWHRGLHARLLERLAELKAKTVVFDVLFYGDGDPPRADEDLVEAAKKHGKVAIAAAIRYDVHEGRIVGSQQVFKPYDRLADVASYGMVEETPGDSIRKQFNRADFQIPSLAWRAAELTATNLPADPFR